MNKTMLELINACDEKFSSSDPAVNAAVLGAQNVNSAISTIDELRQQLADVSHERDLLRVERNDLEQLLLDVDAALDSEEISPGYDLELKIAKVYTARAKRAEVKS
ncbi:hypothetical protein CFBP3846_03688 [Pseudomonas syringae pv. avii]|uniref:Uncharacterized protein n=1 Tax=Pseudomonas syringae pv. avii TaxID=663959 RepID=A0ABY1U9H9_PSESX|nr:hypothetical protein [Pseudomonas syringae]KWT10591.1 hypothetical protein AL046_00830 [Pseudomonas syringae pv. avii]SOS28095.1 hypothetical protein CFBP3846_03688 [Pseudomonas syringae pv. avii]